MKPAVSESLVKVLFSWNGSCLSAFSTLFQILIILEILVNTQAVLK